MKFITIILLLLLSAPTWAADVNGEVFYTLRSGELVTRDVTIAVPARGQGSVVLKGKSFEWSTENFWSETINDETHFYAVFKTGFKDFKSTVAFKGTYIKANNQIVYYGSMYKKEGHHDVDKDISDFTFSGGFNFSYDR